MEKVIEFNKKDMSVRMMSERDIRRRYPKDSLKILYEDGHAFISNDIEIFFEGCYTPKILLKLDD